MSAPHALGWTNESANTTPESMEATRRRQPTPSLASLRSAWDDGRELYSLSLPAVASHSGAAICSVKFLNIRLNEMLMRSVWPWFDGTLCLSQAGKINMRPSLLSASAALAVSREYCRGLGMIIDGRGSWKKIFDPGGGTATSETPARLVL